MFWLNFLDLTLKILLARIGAAAMRTGKRIALKLTLSCTTIELNYNKKTLHELSMFFLTFTAEKVRVFQISLCVLQPNIFTWNFLVF